MKARAYGCWTLSKKPHPWEDVKDMACGHYARQEDPCCAGCRRVNLGNPEDQLAALNSLGLARGTLNRSTG